MMSGGCFKRLTVREHTDRVRFDPTQVAKLDTSNGFKLVYPRGCNGSAADDDGAKYERFLRKANDIWQVTTGTVRASTIAQQNTAVVKKKRRIRKKVVITANPVDPSMGGGGDEGIPEELPEVEVESGGEDKAAEQVATV